MKSAVTNVVDRLDGRYTLFLLLALAVVFALLMPLFNVVGFDVAFLSWAAGRVLDGAVYGRDVFDINPPLCVIIYMPAALLAPLLGLEGGVRVTMLVVTLLSLCGLWETAERTQRLPLAAALLLFVTFAFPNHFAQREQITLLLCAPYVAGVAAEPRWRRLNGIMAGIGFMMKPYFLIPLALVFALRRRIGPEERAIMGVGLVYGVVLLAFFQPYLREAIPAARATYWAIGFPLSELLGHAGTVLLFTLLMIPLRGSQPGMGGILAAIFGFTAAALIQQKGFSYHFIPAYGFLTMFLALMTRNPRPAAVRLAMLFLVGLAIIFGNSALRWATLQHEQAAMMEQLQAEIDRSESFVAFLPEPAIAFPAAIHTRARFVGISICMIFMPAVASFAAGRIDGDPRTAERLAISHATGELRRKPQIVITLNAPYYFRGSRPFHIQQWLERDPEFSSLWRHYAADKEIGPYLIYRRRP